MKRKIIRAVRLPADIMRDAVSLLADRKIIASRLVQGGPSPRYTFGEPGTWKPSPKTMPMPEQRWHFPPLPTAPDVILLKIFNPNPIAVQATVQIVGTGVRTQARVSPQTSYEMSLSLTVQTHAFDALLVTATGAIIPERWAFSPAGPRLTYGTPLSATR